MTDVVALKPRKRNDKPAANLSELAYDRLEAAIVSCALAPGQFLSIPDLQQRTFDALVAALGSGVDPALFDCNLVLRAAG